MSKVPVLPEVCVEPVTRLADGKPLNISKYTLASHSGTHIDAPVHAIDGGLSIDQIPLERFAGPVVIAGVDCDAGTSITVDQILAGGPPPQRGDMLFVATGWDQHFDTPAYYEHPDLAPEVGEWAVEQGLSLIGSDTLTPELPVSRRREGFAFPLHRTLLGNDVLIAENLRGLTAVAGRRLTAYAFPVLVRGSDAGHVSVVVDTDEAG